MIKVTPTDSTGTAVTLLAQWDRGVTIYFSDDLITSAHLIHFQNTRVAEAIIMKSTYEDGVLSVEVPDVLLERAYPITGFIFVSESDDSGRSLLMFEIQVKQRQRPADTIYENTQEYINAKALIASLAEDVESCSTNADTATAAAESAAASAEAASTSAEAAAESEANAAASAEAAATSEANAAASESAAAESAAAAAEYSGGIVSIEQTALTAESSGRNTVTITKADGTTADFYVYNGAQGEKGDTGNLVWAVFDVNEDSGELEMTMPDEYGGPEFAINDDGYLEVIYA